MFFFLGLFVLLCRVLNGAWRFSDHRFNRVRSFFGSRGRSSSTTSATTGSATGPEQKLLPARLPSPDALLHASDDALHAGRLVRGRLVPGRWPEQFQPLGRVLRQSGWSLDDWRFND